jgi:D-inositol-3-phosphate glycosyltransferase
VQAERAVAIGGVTGVDVPSRFAARFTALSDAVDLDFFAPDVGDRPRGSNSLVVLLPSRVYREKGHLDAVRALGAARERGIDATLVFAGRVESESYLEQTMKAAKSLGVQDRVNVLRQVSPIELRRLYKEADLVILPSKDEGLPRVLIEAQAMGKPVVAYSVGGVPEAVMNGETGWTVEAGNAAQFAQRVADVLDDAESRQKAGARARDFVVSRFSSVALACRHEDFILSALS